MATVTVDLRSPTGSAIKPMHSVNNGPSYKFAADQRISNLHHFQAAGIPYARTHDAAFYATYGGEHIVDIPNIFPDFDADPYDPASYDFDLTDDYLHIIELGGSKVFYRLGNKIEHWRKKYGTLPPKDFHKWAVICEHVIRHYTEGWANGFHMDIEYWEIWNEPDLDPDDSTHKRCWGGTKAEFFRLYDIAAKHLKACFPHLKIGGPAIAHDMQWADDFLAQLTAPLDFFSWHIYAAEPARVLERAATVRGLLDKHGYTQTESILNEWNYVRGWEGDDWTYSLRMEKSLKGAAFIASTMLASQRSSIDNLMFYDARPGGMNSLFSTDCVSSRLKGYYPFMMFNALYQLKQELPTESDTASVYALAAGSPDRAAVMLSHYTDDDAAPAQPVSVRLTGLQPGKATLVTVRLLDDSHDCDEIQRFSFSSDHLELYLTLPLHASMLIELTA